MKAVVVGAGAVGARACRQLLALGELDDLVIVEPDSDRRDAVLTSLGLPARSAPALATALASPTGSPAPPTVVILTNPPRTHAALATTALSHGASVVSVSDDPADVAALLGLDELARRHGSVVVAGAGFSPGLSCLLAGFAGRAFERVEEINVAKVGTGGPACSRGRLSYLRGQAREWVDGDWESNRGGSGRRLSWFPDPIGGLDCYRADLSEPILLRAQFGEAKRIRARMAFRRRDRNGVLRALTSTLTSRLARNRGGEELGALRVEVQGWQGNTLEERVVGAVDRPSLAAGTVAAMAARWILDGRLPVSGAGGLATQVEPGPFLSALAERGVKVALFEGVAAAV